MRGTSGQVFVEPAATLRQRLRMAADALDLLERVHAAHEELVDAQLHLAADPQRRSQQGVERVIDGAFGGVLHRHHAEIREPCFDLVEHLVHRGERQRAHRVTEMLERRSLRERALGPQVADLERFFLRQAGRHDLAEQAQDFFGTQRTLVPLTRHAQHLRLAFGPVEVDGVPVGMLGDADLPREHRAVVEQRVDTRVHAVDLRAQVGERLGNLCRGRRPGSAFLLASHRPQLYHPRRQHAADRTHFVDNPRHPPRHRCR